MQQPPQSNLTFWQKIEMMRAAAMLPALTVMVILRRNLGYRFLNPAYLFGMAFALVVVSALAQQSRNPEGLLIFAAIMLVAGLVERFKRWRETHRGVRKHSYYIGDSYLEFKWLPAFMRRHRRVERFLDPLVCFIFGVLLLALSRALGMWLIFSSFCLRVFEDAVFRRQLDRELDTLDGMIASEDQVEIVERYSVSVEIRRRQKSDSGGIPTGLSPDIQRKIEQRRRRE